MFPTQVVVPSNSRSRASVRQRVSMARGSRSKSPSDGEDQGPKTNEKNDGLDGLMKFQTKRRETNAAEAAEIARARRSTTRSTMRPGMLPGGMRRGSSHGNLPGATQQGRLAGGGNGLVNPSQHRAVNTGDDAPRRPTNRAVAPAYIPPGA